ncbi:hypothetical protein P9869_20030 [Streptomyces ossamyceticus]|nr:hypothetical protein [Streptomyces ossamyceticus]
MSTSAGDRPAGRRRTCRAWPPRAGRRGRQPPSHLEFRCRWFDRALGRTSEPGSSGGGSGLPVVRYFLMGGGDGRLGAAGRMWHGGAWRTDSRRPPASAAPVTLYLTADGGLALTPPAAPDASVTYDFDPRDPAGWTPART